MMKKNRLCLQICRSITTNTHLQLVRKTAPSETWYLLFSGKTFALNSKNGFLALHSVVKSCGNTFKSCDKNEAKKKGNKAFIFNCTVNQPQVVPLCDTSLIKQHPENTADFNRDSCKKEWNCLFGHFLTFQALKSIKMQWVFLSTWVLTSPAGVKTTHYLQIILLWAL